MLPFLVESRLWQDPRMLCKACRGVPLQLFRVQLRILHHLVGAGERFGPPMPPTEPPHFTALVSGPVVAWPWDESAHSIAEY